MFPWWGGAGQRTSASYYLFYQCTSITAPNSTWLIKNLIDAIGNPNSFDTYLKIYNRYVNNNGVDSRNGRLLQIFIDPSAVDDLCYLSLQVGRMPFSSTFKALRNQVKLDLAYWLKNREQVEKGTFFHGKIPLQEGYKLAYEQVHGGKSYTPKESTYRLHAIIKKDDLDAFKSFMQNPKFDINMKLATKDKKLSSILGIVINNNALKITEYLFKTLIKSDAIRIVALKNFNEVDFNYEKVPTAEAWIRVSAILKDISQEYLAKALEDVKAASNYEKEKVAQSWIAIPEELNIQNTKERKNTIGNYHALLILSPIVNQDIFKVATENVKEAASFNKEPTAETWVKVSGVVSPKPLFFRRSISIS